MNEQNLTVGIRLTSRMGQEPKMFRAYEFSDGHFGVSLGISASTTGNDEGGVRRCAAKAFAYVQRVRLPRVARELEAALNQITPQVTLRARSKMSWVAELPACFDIGLICPPTPAPRHREPAGRPGQSLPNPQSES